MRQSLQNKYNVGRSPDARFAIAQVACFEKFARCAFAAVVFAPHDPPTNANAPDIAAPQ
jgi:hypothetical protein